MTDLSPSAQAVLDAVMQYEIKPECYSREYAAVVLRTAADQLINVKWSCEMWELHRDFHAIAAELDGAQ